jgi:hypothetical protein
MALSYDEINAVTTEFYMPKLVDNIFTSNILLQRAKKKWMRLQDGGTKVIVPLAYNTTTSSGWYQAGGSLDVTANDQITAAEFDWKNIYANITITRQDELMNSGKEAKVRFVESKVQLAEKTLSQNLGTALYNLGTDNDAIVGLRLAVDSAGTYGGIDRSTYTWFSAQEDSTTTTLTIGAMQSLYGDCTIGSDMPTVLPCTQDVYDDYFGLLQPQQRFSDSETANGGFQNLLYVGKPIVVDNQCPSGHLFMLNENYLELTVQTKENFRFEPFQKPINQNSSSAKIYWTGALSCSNPRLQGKMTAIA